jgi:type IV secretory pathway VirB10-like protein
MPRPSISAWAVNQLYWTEQDLFESMLSSARRVRDGDLSAGPRHRDAIADLRDRAAELLTKAGHGAADATLRRIATTLSAIAASGGFDPDPPGALGADRDPPGFEAMNLVVPIKPPREAPREAPRDDRKREAEKREAEKREAERREEERRRAEEDALKRRERIRLEATLRVATFELEKCEREVERCREELARAEADRDRARAHKAELEHKLADVAVEK